MRCIEGRSQTSYWVFPACFNIRGSPASWLISNYHCPFNNLTSTEYMYFVRTFCLGVYMKPRQAPVLLSGVRIYCRKAVLYHLSSIWMVESSPAVAAIVAAPIQKLWPANLFWELHSLQCCSNMLCECCLCYPLQHF